jgi:endonuclease/exonuclease/phosphatase family metal-dependent hydrolase
VISSVLPPRAPGTLRFVSYNVHKAVGTDRRADPARILRVVAAMAADVVILQEADRRLGPRPTALPRGLIAEITGLVPIAAGQSHVSLGWHGNAILTRPDIHLTGLERLDLPGLEPRGALIADLAAPEGLLRVCGLHLGLLRPSRRAQLSALTAALNATAPSPTVIGGDFNEWSTEVGLGRLTRTFSLLTPGKSFHARRPVAHLDRFAHDAGVSLVDAGVAEGGQARVASDHLPIWMDARLTPA